MDVTGNWTLFYDWDCDGSYSSTAMNVNADGTWTIDEGSSGLWTQTAGMFMFNFKGYKTAYAGNLASKSITGIMTTFNGLQGCFYMLQDGAPSSFAALRVSGKPDASGN